MKEDLLQFIWKFKYYNSHQLKTVHGEDLVILNQGTQNFDQGPDFLNAKIQINGTVWVGNIELHINARQWYQHRHQHDKNYQNVILHVVWHFDGDIEDCNGQRLPALELKDKVSSLLLDKYQALMEKEQQQDRFFIPCENLLENIDDLRWDAWKSRLATERLEYKTEKVFEILSQTNYHWDEAMWRMIAGNFGGKMNGQLFHNIAVSISQNLFARHKHQLIAIEAMLFGQAGLLEEDFDAKYPKMLKMEYEFYKQKYQLLKADGNLCFARMRPANFPTIRLAQLAALIHKSSHLFSKVLEFNTIEQVIESLRVTPNDFWLYHYKLTDADNPLREKPLGKQMMENIIINTISPILFAYGMYHKDERQKEKAIDWLERLPPEKNTITKGFHRLGVTIKNAFDSQALIQLKKFYCDKRRCLECGIGNVILGKTV